MNSKEIKDYVIDNDKIEYVLSELGCHNIRLHGGKYFSCGFPDGDNSKAITVYTDTLRVNAYTRDIVDAYGSSDIISLVCFIKQIYFTKALKWICEILGLDYYKEEVEDLPESLKITKLLVEMADELTSSEEVEYLKPVPETVLKTYYPYLSKLFKDDNVGYETQLEFEIMYDLASNRVVIPIRDELGTLVGVKGRTLDNNPDIDKYIYLEPCAKTKILYGLYKTLSYIKEAGFVIVVESEKSVMKLWGAGIKNVVAIGGHDLSKTQIEKITMLGIMEVVLCYDQDVGRLENGKLDKKVYKKEAQKFIEQLKVSAMVDLDGTILNTKESPADDMDKFTLLFERRKEI